MWTALPTTPTLIGHPQHKARDQGEMREGQRGRRSWGPVRGGVPGPVAGFWAQRRRKEETLAGKRPEGTQAVPAMRWAWGYWWAPFCAVGMSYLGQDPKFLTLDPLELEVPEGTHCMEGKTEAHRGVWLAQSQCAWLVEKLASMSQSPRLKDSTCPSRTWVWVGAVDLHSQ